MPSISTSTSTAAVHANPMMRRVLNKVPEVTIYFWIIKVLCTTVGESAADFLNYNLNWGLTLTSVATGILLAVVLAMQISLGRYIAAVYWLTVMLVSVFGTLVTDNLTDNLGVPLEASTIAFSVLLAVVFYLWHRSEGTLSIHSIYTRRRESFYWLAILVTFALGTAFGDLVSERLGVGYLGTGLLCAALIAIVAVAWRLGLNAVLAFWVAYILTRPLGASIGDFLAQPGSAGGLALGVGLTSLILLSAIVATVIYLTVRKPDVIEVPENQLDLTLLDEPETAPHHQIQARREALLQTVAVVAIAVVAGVAFYSWRTVSLNAAAAQPAPAASGAAAAASSPLGDMTEFVVISQDTLDLLATGQQSDATTRITDLETAWDDAAATLQRRDSTQWHAVDDKIDAVLRQLRSTHPDTAGETAALEQLLTQMGAQQ